MKYPSLSLSMLQLPLPSINPSSFGPASQPPPELLGLIRIDVNLPNFHYLWPRELAGFLLQLLPNVFPKTFSYLNLIFNLETFKLKFFDKIKNIQTMKMRNKR